MTKFLHAPVCLFVLSVGCTSGITKNEVLQNDKIDGKLRAEIAVLTKQAYKSLCDNNYGALSQLFSDSLLYQVTPDFAQKFMPQIQRVIKDRPSMAFDEFYIRTVKAVDSVGIQGGKADNAYSLRYLTGGKESYISMLVSGDSLNEVMVTLIYVKVDGKWKMNSIIGEDYSLSGRNAVAQYQHAKALYNKGHLIDAVNLMSLTGHCAAPAGRMFSYAKEKEMSDFYDTVSNAVKAKYPLPYTMGEVTTKPQMVNVHYEVLERRFVPMVVYQSSIMLTDTVSLAKENDEMQKNIGRIFPGLDQNSTAILYRAYNQLPQGEGDQKPYYGYLQKFK